MVSSYAQETEVISGVIHKGIFMRDLLGDVKAGAEKGSSVGGYVGNGVLATFAVGVLSSAASSNPVTGSLLIVALAGAYAVGLTSVAKNAVVVTSSVVGGVGGLGYGMYRIFTKPADKLQQEASIEIVVVASKDKTTDEKSEDLNLDYESDEAFQIVTL